MKQGGSWIGGRAPYWLLLSAVSLFVLVLFLAPVPRHAGINDHPEAMFRDVMQGTSERPFVGRPLVPWLVRTLAAVTPGTVTENLRSWADQDETGRAVFARLRWSADDATLYLWTTVVSWIAFLLFAHFTARLALLTTPAPDRGDTRLLLACVSLLGVPPFFRFTTFVYDPAQLFLWALGLVLIRLGRNAAFVVVFALATLNKETAILLIPVWALHAGSEGRNPLRGSVVLFAIFATLRLGIHILTNEARGNYLEAHLVDHNVAFLLRGYSLPELSTLAVMGIGLFLFWRRKNPFLKNGLLVVLPPLLLMGLLFGYFDEWRDYFEAYPIGFALLVDTVVRLNRGMFDRGPVKPSGTER